jgi:uncharacterized protein (DUF2141 family)
MTTQARSRKEIEMNENFRRTSLLALLPLACLSLFIFTVQYSTAQTPNTGTLTIKITGIGDSEGNIGVALRTGENTIVDSKVVETDPKPLIAEAVFDNLAAGTQGVAVIHDENKNEKRDFNDMGMPVEGYRHSDNPAKRLGPPNFDETKFAFAALGSTMAIALVYWS